MSGLADGGTVARIRRMESAWTVAGAVAIALGTWSGDVRAQDNPGNNPGRIDLGEVVVTGTRLQRAAEAGAGHSPLKTFYEVDIARLGVTNVADVLKYVTQEPFRANEFTQPGGVRIAQLRGLAIGNTLVLVNGRRVTSSATLGAVGAFNLNTIPLSAVSRIDVLSDSASAVYGTDAVGGVVNIVLRDNIEAPELNFYYGNADGGARERRTSFAIGSTGARYRVAFTADYFDRGYLLGSERDPSSNQDFTSQGGVDARTAVAPLANIARSGAGNLPGVNSPRATVPAGSTGTITQAAFAATAGQINRTSTLQYASIVPQAERIGATLVGKLELTDSLTAFAEGLYSKQEDDRLTAPSVINNAAVPANNPFNPFGVPVTASFQDTTAAHAHTVSDLVRGTAGLRASFGTWDGELSVVNSSENGSTFTENTLDLARVNAALRSTDPAVALNIFQDGYLLPDLLDPYRVIPLTDRFSSDSLMSNAFVRGGLFDLPAGEVSVVFGLEHRHDHVHFEATGSGISLTNNRDVRSAFTEASVPIIGEEMDVPLARKVIVTLAARYDDYTDFGDTTNPQYGLEWTMFSPLLLRVSYGDAFRAPSLFDIYQPMSTLTSPVLDPRRGNVSTPTTLILGGNPDLTPEESTSFSAGFVYSPDVAAQPRVSVTYSKITQTSRLQSLNQTGVLANEDFLPGRVVRAPQTPADIAAGRPGALQSVDLRKLNAGSLSTNVFDLDFSLNLKSGAGTFAPNVSGTFVNRFRAADLPVSPVTDRRGSANTLGSIPTVRLTASVPWSLHGFSLAPTARYISAYDDVNNLNVPAGRKVDSQVLLDLQASVDFEAALGRSPWSEGVSLSLGALNLLNKEAPFALVGGAQGFDTSQGDLRERFVYVSLRKSFGSR